MTRSEALQVAKPILFNTEMARAIQNGTKTATRRLVKSNKADLSKCRFVSMSTDPSETRIARNGDEYPHELKGLYATFEDFDGGYFPLVKAPYQIGDILYVRETWCRIGEDVDKIYFENSDALWDGMIIYRADGIDLTDIGKWRPSIHMPKEAARIFLSVTGVRVQKLRPMDFEDFEAEGLNTIRGLFATTADFADLWDSTIKKSDLEEYSWEANPWVWVIEFKRVDVNG